MVMKSHSNNDPELYTAMRENYVGAIIPSIFRTKFNSENNNQGITNIDSPYSHFWLDGMFIKIRFDIRTNNKLHIFFVLKSLWNLLVLSKLETRCYFFFMKMVL